ncbi:hypothetical protein A3H80_00675 [Candidatus Roizmanbacteria bacterium RIFCSPLOWO2_02_FULL_37_19]|uniref:Ribulose-phosphate 3-epimerase n=1 Tax=Candidatus Roizmanbacteria bacterium RIFCSPHIGHO2_02_FULL_37_24 TaxID=1802037 RepID=A0A1F7GUV6_9BACT|nr:MAG: hypothetical protein A2862_00365 [Candidatus Roizmanbacteria bacterium RIFCSPHIGHO2_01_FULL_38_41]OGK22651.1 MAG: hypothetical protein A3C24_00480 [Candidatus Roizmanbacteria bacterium RIFCSPHIGHO2_02_FULL_37_24]OGK32501.1 MAG: hypothetical protein A3E10_00545 [Candidatus Roizmanbacteria bacterium RIFCSPHIGHO2_12_FULL_37_23]OGK45116.1 MAG: hypothetical protein A2956_02950 [Candidatus Roizmanbacteria bacterium RIFCSPLOWO2_01_FULL_37_57]OGK54481.1 MAG: hypothetical protein A3H80_00675 [Ca
MLIYPSILEPTVDDLFTYLQTLFPVFNHFQIDIADGKFVQSKTVQIEEIIKSIQNSDFKTENKTFEFHLMVKDYENELKKLEKLKERVRIQLVLIHVEALQKIQAISSNSQITHNPQSTNHSSFELGLALNPDTSIESHWPIIQQHTTVQLMTVHPGQQGSPFVPEVLDKITILREKGFKGEIILDGAMNDKTLPIILSKKYWPDAICPGSYFKHNPKQQLEKLSKTIIDYTS